MTPIAFVLMQALRYTLEMPLETLIHMETKRRCGVWLHNICSSYKVKMSKAINSAAELKILPNVSSTYQKQENVLFIKIECNQLQRAAF